MPRLALKVDVDTLKGTLEGVPRLAGLFERLGLDATFLLSLGPDHTGRAIKRVFRGGFIGKVRRTSVLEHYGLRTLLYGTVLPGPDIGRRCRGMLRSLAQRGFEVGVHTFDHVKWQDGVAKANEHWTRDLMQRAHDRFVDIFGRIPQVHGAAGWQVNASVPFLEQALGYRYASDVRGRGPFIPIVDGEEARVPQLPTTLPTLDELIGRNDLREASPVDALLRRTGPVATTDHVFTLHAEIEGGAYLDSFARLLAGWRDQGYEVGALSSLYASLDVSGLPRCAISQGSIPGRSGMLACQMPQTPDVSASD